MAGDGVLTPQATMPLVEKTLEVFRKSRERIELTLAPLV